MKTEKRLETLEKEVNEIKEILKPKEAGNPVTCNNCGYSWKTRSKMKYISCSNCKSTFKNPLK